MSALAGVSADRTPKVVAPLEKESRTQHRKRARWEEIRVSYLAECKELAGLVWEHPIKDLGSVIERIQSLCKRLREDSQRLSKSSPRLQTAFAGHFTKMLTTLEWVGKQGFHRKESYEIRQLVHGMLESSDVLKDIETWRSTETVALSVDEVVQQHIIARAQLVEARIKGIIKLLEGYCEELTTSTLTLREDLKQDYKEDLVRWKQYKRLLSYKTTLGQSLLPKGRSL